MERMLFLIYLCSLSLTSAFAITSTVTVPVFLSLFIVLLFFLGEFLNKGRILTLEPDDIVLFLFLFSVYFGFLINNTQFRSSKPFNHLVAYSYIIIINYYFLKNIYYSLYQKYGEEFINNSYGAICLGLFITCAFGLTEFWLKNFLGIEVDNYIPRPAVTEYEPMALTNLIRLRSFVEESGHLAYFIEVLGPLSLYYVRRRKVLFYLLLTVVSSCFLLTFSTAGWLIVTFTGLLLLIWNIKPTCFMKGITFKYRKVIKYTSVLALVLVVLAFNYEVVNYISAVLNEIILAKVNQSSSAEDRTARFVEGMNALTQSNIFRLSFGNGPAVYDTLRFSRGGTILLYLTYALESGLVGLLLFLIFCGVLTYKANKIRNRNLRFVLLFGLISSFLHFFLISNYWYPWFWILAIIIQTNYRIEHSSTLKPTTAFH